MKRTLLALLIGATALVVVAQPIIVSDSGRPDKAVISPTLTVQRDVFESLRSQARALFPTNAVPGTNFVLRGGSFSVPADTNAPVTLRLHYVER
jgi:hypothetical protein